MLRFEDVRSVHLEVTDKCNAACPMCPRTINGGPLNPHLRMIEMSLADAQRIFSEDFLRQLRFIQLCGNFGDPMVAQDTLEILKYFRQINPTLSLGIHTNGSLRNKEWWTELGHILSRAGDYCKYALDGLADTNHIYRRNTQWNKIMENVRSFISAGGIAHWEFLVFKHNEHQVETARAMARDMGFQSFFLKKTSRFFDYQTGKNEAFPIFNKSGETIDFLYPPEKNEFLNPVSRFFEQKEVESSAELSQSHKNKVETAVKKSSDLLKTFGSLKKYFSQTEVSCMASREKSIYVTAKGEVFPCCFLSGQVRYPDPGQDGQRLSALASARAGDPEGPSALTKSIKSAIDGGFFSGIEENWSLPARSAKTIHTCRRMCGTHLQLVDGEYG